MKALTQKRIVSNLMARAHQKRQEQIRAAAAKPDYESEDSEYEDDDDEDYPMSNSELTDLSSTLIQQANRNEARLNSFTHCAAWALALAGSAFALSLINFLKG